MKVLLVNPPEKTQVVRSMGMKLPPLGLMYLAAFLEKKEIGVEILDANLDGLSYEQIAGEIRRRGPDIVGVTATTMTLGSAKKVLQASRHAKPDAVTVIGGAHATYMPSATMVECSALDVGVIGEGEETTLELVKALEGFSWDGDRVSGGSRSRELAGRLKPVRGLVYRDGSDANAILRTPARPYIQDLDSLPFPARHLVPFNRYTVWNQRTTIGHIMTSRGCPFACNFCVSSRMAGIRYRARSAKNIVDEMTLLHEKYGLDNIELMDDTFTMDPRRARAVAAEIRARGLKISWKASSRVNTINGELIADLKKSGLDLLYFGVESGSQRVLDLMNKRITPDQARAAFRAARDNGIETVGSFILGYPGESLDEMRQTIRFACELNPDYAQFTILTPYPGTPVYEELKDAGNIMPADWDSYNLFDPLIRYEAYGYTREDVKRMLTRAYVSYYMRPSYLAHHIHMVPGMVRAATGALIG